MRDLIRMRSVDSYYSDNVLYQGVFRDLPPPKANIISFRNREKYVLAVSGVAVHKRFDLVVFAGFAVSADAQEKLAGGKIGGTDVALLLANPDLLVGDLLKNTKTSQTFRLYSSPDVKINREGSQFRVTVEGVDSFDAATGEVTSFGKSGIAAWFLDDEYDGTVFRVSQAFFPVSNGWQNLARALRGTVDAELVEELHSWTSLPFNASDSGRIAVRVVSNDGNSSEVVLDLSQAGTR
jgi:adenine-specific DNA-methyltransferase